VTLDGRLVSSSWRTFTFLTRKSGGDSSRTSDLSRVNAFVQEPLRKLKADENTILNGTSGISDGKSHPHILNPTSEAQERNDRALAVLNRVQHKLTGL
jgi:hypothetical protein